MTKDNKKGTKPPKHWSQNVHEIVISPTEDGSPNFTVRGGAENGLFPFVADVRSDRILLRSGKLHTDDIVIEVNGHRLPGFTLWDIEALMAHVGRAPLHLKTVKQGQTLNKDLRRYLNMRFQKGSVDHDLQQTIRENLYVRTVPCTTRAPREGEVDGVDYKFLSVDEFMALEKSGHLLESGVFDGNHYGTPKPPAKPPPAQSPTSSSSPPPPAQQPQQNNSSSTNTSPKKSAAHHRPGAKPSAPGKRQRNKSTIEATTLNSDPLDEEEQRRREEIQRAEEELGELPVDWEIAFTDQGDMYFIYHVTETTQWLDPRLEHKPAKDLLDCEDDGEHIPHANSLSDNQELPHGWEKIDDPQFGTYFIDHINRKTQYANPVLHAKEEAQRNDANRPDGRYSTTLPRSARSSQSSLQAGPQPSRALSDPNIQENGHLAQPQLSTSPVKTTSDAEWRAMFTSEPDKLEGQLIRTVLTKSKRGFGFTIVGGDDSEEFLQIKSVVPTGPAASNGVLKTGDVLVFVKSDATPQPVKVLGYTHQQVVTLFQAIMPGEQVHLQVCRGYPLPFDPDDPNTHIVTSYAISPTSNQPGVKIPSTPSSSSAFRKHNSLPPDKIHNNIGPPSYKDVNMTHVFKHDSFDTPPPPPRISSGHHPNHHHHGNHRNGDSGSNLSRDTHVKSLPDLTAPKPREMEVTGSPRAKTPTLSLSLKPDSLTLPNDINSRGSMSSEHQSESPSSTQPEIHAIQFVKGNQGFGFTVADSPYGQKVKQILASQRCKTLKEGDILVEINEEYIRDLPHNQVVNKLKECPLGVETTIVVQRGGMLKPVRSLSKIKPVKTPKTPEPRDKEDLDHKVFRNSEDRDYRPHSNGPHKESDNVVEQRPPSRAKPTPLTLADNKGGNFIETTVFLKKHNDGFGFRIVGGLEEQSQVAIGNIVPNGAADLDGRLITGDELLYIDGQSVIRSSHQEVVNLMIKASQSGRVSLGIRRKVSSPTASVPVGKNTIERRPLSEPQAPRSPGSPTKPSAVTFPYDVAIHRRANEGFGLVILSSTLTSGSKIGRIIEGSPTDRCGKVKVGDRLIAVNRVDIMNMHHKDIVNMIKDAGLSVTLTIGPPEEPVAGNSPKANESMTNALAMPAHIKSSDTSLLQRDSFREGPKSPATPTADPYSRQHEPQYPTAPRWRSPSEPVRGDHRDPASSSSRSTPQPSYESRSPTSYHNQQHNPPHNPQHNPQHNPRHNPQHNPQPYQQQQPSVPYSEPSREPYSRPGDYATEPAYHHRDRPSSQPYPQSVDSYHAPHHSHPQQPSYQQSYRRPQEPNAPPSHGMYDDQPEIEPGDYYAVELERGAMGFGFSIRGGREFQNTPLFVLRMAEEGPAAQGGLVRVGDQIIEINSHSTDGMLHSEAIEVIRRGGKRVRLLLRRSGPPPASDDGRGGMLKTVSNTSLQSADQAFHQHHYPNHHPHRPQGPGHRKEAFDTWSYRSLPRGMRY
ncbi:membrane-associated guanylate kinase, WW and PDZ domain-containing protein 1-like isoform X6 [Patiria miniata]|uniref:Uncharacterized protein n=1 Tax=Patiria miniata TaxID=46514 RepID=A0A914AXK6_PATMI|nr:membrane-associated guanylate kinase, WW and PDZ domain-containing protein 1-like isoform X6 [Patiria miniata]